MSPMTLAIEKAEGSARSGPSIILLAALVIGAVLALQMPAVDTIRPRAHAVERHGQDAIAARRAVRLCKPTDLRVQECPRSSKYGRSLVWWCEPEGAALCPGRYTTVAGIEKTAFVRPCYKWRTCQ